MSLEKGWKIQNTRNVDGGNREIERRRRWQGGAESGGSSGGGAVAVAALGAAGCYHEKQASTLIF